MVWKCLRWLAQRLAFDSLSQMCGIWCHNSAQSGQTGASRGKSAKMVACDKRMQHNMAKMPAGEICRRGFPS